MESVPLWCGNKVERTEHIVNAEVKTPPVFGGNEADKLSLELLTRETLQSAIVLANSVFPQCRDLPESPEIEYRATIDPTTYREAMTALGLDSQEHWVLKKRQSVVGLTGLQHKTLDEPEVAWLGWFCLDPTQRGQKLGKRFLEWTISTARLKGYTVLRLHTTDLPSQSKAQVLYEKLGFRVIDPRDLDPRVLYNGAATHYGQIYREKPL